MFVVNTDALYHRNKSPEKCLQMSEKDKNKNDLESCLQIICHFSPFFVLVDDLLGMEAWAKLKCIEASS